MELQQAIDLYTEVILIAAPCAFVFSVCNILVNIVINAFCNGKLRIGGKN